MGQYLVCFDKTKTPVLVFFDITDFEEQNIKDMTILTFTEEGIDYTYFGTDGKDFKEAHKAAPDFDTYKLMTDKEAKKSGLLKNFPSQNSTASLDADPDKLVDDDGNPIGTLDSKIIKLPDGRMVSMNDILKMSPEEKKEIEDMIKKSSLTEAKEEYYMANRDGSFPATSGTKLSNGLFAHKKDTNFMLWCVSDIASGLLVKGKLKTLKDCKDYVANMPEEEKQKLEEIRQTQEYLDLCDKLKENKGKVSESLSSEQLNLL